MTSPRQRNLEAELGLDPGETLCPVEGCDPLVEGELTKSQVREHTARCNSSPGCFMHALMNRIGPERLTEIMDRVESER